MPSFLASVTSPFAVWAVAVVTLGSAVKLVIRERSRNARYFAALKDTRPAQRASIIRAAGEFEGRTPGRSDRNDPPGRDDPSDRPDRVADPAGPGRADQATRTDRPARTDHAQRPAHSSTAPPGRRRTDRKTGTGS